MWPAGRPLPPMSNLPPLQQLDRLTETQVLSALDNLSAIYCPVMIPRSALFASNKTSKVLDRLKKVPDSGYNSGYASENEDDNSDDRSQGRKPFDKDLALIRADKLERSFAARWLEKFLIRATEHDPRPECFLSDDSQQIALEKAADLLTAILNPGHAWEHEEQHDQDQTDEYFRDFTFSHNYHKICVRLNDGISGSTDHTDVGLQTWGASIVLCRMLCEDPLGFGFSTENLGQSPSVVELGAGTGLVSLVLAQLFPRLGFAEPVLVATDYHPSVMSNLRINIAANICEKAPTCPVYACELDWVEPETTHPSWPLGDKLADMLIATDVVYAPEHAALLHHCASRILAPEGVFWLLQTVRQNGRHGDVINSVEAAFSTRGETRCLGILDIETLERRDDVGRADETFYRLYKIKWV